MRKEPHQLDGAPDGWQGDAASKTHTGAEAADPAVTRQGLIEAHMGLVVSIARRYAGRGLPLEDLISEGVLGLIYAIDRFEPVRGVKFTTFAGKLIQYSIQRAIGESAGLVRLPPKARRMVARWVRAAHQYRMMHGRPADPAFLAAELGIPVHLVREVEDAKTVQWINGDGAADNLPHSARPADDRWLPDGGASSGGESFAGLREAIEGLGAVRATVVRLHFGLTGARPMPLREVAREMGMSLARARFEFDMALVLLRRSVAYTDGETRRAGPNSNGTGARDSMSRPGNGDAARS
jgi:RNA polymerase sigma factor (sigma-70 family)